MTRKELIDLLLKNQFEELFEALIEIANTEKKEDLAATISIIVSQYHKLKETELRGTESRDKIDQNYNVLREKIIGLISEIFKEEKSIYQRISWKRILFPMVIISLFSAVLYWGMQPQPSWTNFKLEAELDQISFEVGAKKNLIDEDLLVSMLITEPIEACIFDDKRHLDLNHYLEVYGDFFLRELLVAKNTPMTFNKDYDDLILSFSGNFVTGTLVSQGNSSLEISPYLPDTEFPFPIAVNQTIEFQTVKTNSNLVISPKELSSFKISDITLNTLESFSEIDPSTGNPVSTLKRGALIYDKKDTVLQEFHTIDMDEMKNGKLNIENGEESLKITLEGSAYNLQMGYPGTLLPLTQNSRIESYFSGSKVNLIFQFLVIALGLLLAFFVFQRRKIK